MRKILTAIVLSIVICVTTITTAAVAFAANLEENVKRVLFLSSYSFSYSPVVSQYNGIKDGFGDGVLLDCEFLNAKNIPYTTEERKTELKEYFEKYFERVGAYDAIIVGDDEAMSFVAEFQTELFNETPIIFEGVGFIGTANEYAENDFITGIVEEHSYFESLGVAIKLLPNSKTINIIYDETDAGANEIKQFKTALGQYSGYQLGDINASQLSKEDLIAKLKLIPANQICFYLSLEEDMSGNTYDTEESLALIRNNVTAPVFVANDIGIGDCFVGGYVYSHKEAGELAAKTVKKVFDGTAVKDIAVEKVAPAEYIFEYGLLQRYRLDYKLLPDGATILNYEPTTWEKYSKAIIPAIVVVSLLLAGLAFLIIMYNKRKGRITQLDFLAAHDIVTGLANKRCFSEMLNGSIKTDKGYIMVLGINDFKSFNDIFGHFVGDAILKKIGIKLHSLEEENIKLFRYAGADYAIMLKTDDKTVVEAFLNKLIMVCNSEINVEKFTMKISYSIGIASYPEDGYNEFDLINAAMAAKAMIQPSDEKRYAYFKDTAALQEQNNAFIQKEIESAIADDRIYMVFQPQYDTNGDTVYGYEALMRIKNSECGPAKFIKVAEETGYMAKLGRIAVDKVIDFMILMKKENMSVPRVSINFSVKQLSDVGFMAYVENKMLNNDLPIELLCLEITESIFNDPEDELKVEALSKKAADYGIIIALDDFGTGNSSVNTLEKHKFTIIKFDKCITDKVTESSAVENLIRFVHSFNFKVMAEGVETKKQYDAFAKYGCDYIQGYYLSRPKPAQEIVDIAKQYMTKGSI